jgi:hypothetical protein
VFALDIRDGGVRTIRSVINPDQLRHLGPVATCFASPTVKASAPRCVVQADVGTNDHAPVMIMMA